MVTVVVAGVWKVGVVPPTAHCQERKAPCQWWWRNLSLSMVRSFMTPVLLMSKTMPGNVSPEPSSILPDRICLFGDTAAEMEGPEG